MVKVDSIYLLFFNRNCLPCFVCELILNFENQCTFLFVKPCKYCSFQSPVSLKITFAFLHCFCFSWDFKLPFLFSSFFFCFCFLIFCLKFSSCQVFYHCAYIEPKSVPLSSPFIALSLTPRWLRHLPFLPGSPADTTDHSEYLICMLRAVWYVISNCRGIHFPRW